MPAKKPSNRNSKRKLILGGFKMWGIAIGIVLVVVLVVGCIFISSDNSWRASVEVSNLESYLKTKYGEDFAVTDVHIVDQTAGDAGIAQGQAYPKHNPSLRFMVEGSLSNDIAVGQNRYDDQYVAALWSRSENQAFKPEIQSIFGNDKDTSVSLRLVISGRLLQIATKTSPTLNKAITHYSDNLFYNIDIQSSEPNKTAIKALAVKMYALVRTIEAKGVKMISINSKINSNGNVMRHDCATDKWETDVSSVTNIDKCIQGLKD